MAQIHKDWKVIGLTVTCQTPDSTDNFSCCLYIWGSQNFWSWKRPSRLLSKDKETKTQSFWEGCLVSSGFKYHSLLQMIAMTDKIFLGSEGGREEVSHVYKQEKQGAWNKKQAGHRG